MKSQGKLRHNKVVTTVMSNLGFRKAMAEAEIEVVETNVGDRYVLEAMQAHKVVLGGEQSGHIIFLDRGRTGDGLLTAVRLLDVVAGSGKELRELRKEAMVEFPQVLVNVPVERGFRLEDAARVWDEVRTVEVALGEDGRVLVRASGTEPLVRVMVEAVSQEQAIGYSDQIARVVAATNGAG
jgi:phosphoglucosamine mutase